MNKLLWIHVGCMLLSYIAFLAACVSSALFLIQERQLKRKRIGSLFHRLPSLDALDRFSLLCVSAGFALLSIGTLLGFVSAKRVLGHWWTGDPKEVMTIGLWGWYFVLWAVRARSTLRGRRVALLSVLGFGVFIFTWIGTTLLLSSLHPYRTI